MSREKQELVKELESRRKELDRLLTHEEDDPVNKDASKDEARIRDEIADLSRRLKIIEKEENRRDGG